VGARLRLAVGSRDGSAAIIEENEEMHYLQTLNYLSFTTPVSALTPPPPHFLILLAACFMRSLGRRAPLFRPAIPDTASLLHGDQVSCVRWRPGPDDQPASALAIAEMGSGQQPAAVIICQRSEALGGDDDPSPVILSRFTVRRDTVRTLAWEPQAGERVVRASYHEQAYMQSRLSSWTQRDSFHKSLISRL
jgi:hypothetical protein